MRREASASIAVNAGGCVKSVQRMLGRAAAAMTNNRYADLFDGLNRLLDQIDAVHSDPTDVRISSRAETIYLVTATAIGPWGLELTK